MTDEVFQTITDEQTLKIQEKCKKTGLPHSEILVKPGNVSLPNHFKNHYDRLINFVVRPDDTWLITFPKCGKFTRF